MSKSIYLSIVLNEIKSLKKIRSLNRPYRKTTEQITRYTIVPCGKKCEHGCGNDATMYVRGKNNSSGLFVCDKIPAKCPAISQKCVLKNLNKEEFRNRVSAGKTRVNENGLTSAQMGALKMREIDDITGLRKSHIAAMKGVAKRIKSGPDSRIGDRKQEYAFYKREVQRHTRQSYSLYKEFINPSDLPIGKKSYHIDHIYSIVNGFINNIPAEIIGHYSNLQVLLGVENCRKNHRSWLTLEKLYEKYNSITSPSD